MDLILATSKAGHDRGQTFVVLNEENDFLSLANGTTKTLEKPKKKKKIHVQIIKNIPAEVTRIYDEVGTLNDLSIKRILKIYSRRNEDV